MSVKDNKEEIDKAINEVLALLNLEDSNKVLIYSIALKNN